MRIKNMITQDESNWYFNNFSISERFRQFYFFTKRLTLLVKNSRKTKFLHSFSVEQNAKLLPFFYLGQKLRKGTFFWKKKNSGIFSFRVNDILTSILSALHPFLTLPNDVLKRKRGTFFRFQAISWKAQKGTFFAVESDVLKSAKKVPLLNVFKPWEAI